MTQNLDEAYKIGELRTYFKTSLGIYRRPEFKRTDNRFWLPLCVDMMKVAEIKGTFDAKAFARKLESTRKSWEPKLGEGTFDHAISLLKKGYLLITNNFKKAKALSSFYSIALNSPVRVAVIELTEEQRKNVRNSPKYGIAQYRGLLEAKILIITNPGEDSTKSEILETFTKLHSAGVPSAHATSDKIVIGDSATSTPVDTSVPKATAKVASKVTDLPSTEDVTKKKIKKDSSAPSVVKDEAKPTEPSADPTLVDGKPRLETGKDPFSREGLSITRTGYTNPPFTDFKTPVAPQDWIDGVKAYHKQFSMGHELKSRGMTTEKWHEYATKKLRDMVARANPYMRVPEKAMLKILKSGKFMNQMETGSSRGMFDPGRRKRIEQTMMGVAKKSTASDHPVYGYMAEDALDFTTRAGQNVSQYGLIMCELDPAVRFRSTMTVGDSLNKTGGASFKSMAPSPMRNPSALSIHGRDIGESFDWKSVDDIYEYPEIQIYGDVSIKIIKKVYIIGKSGWKSIDMTPVPQIVAKLDELGIPWEPINLDLDGYIKSVKEDDDEEKFTPRKFEDSKTYIEATKDPSNLLKRDPLIGDLFMRDVAKESGKGKLDTSAYSYSKMSGTKKAIYVLKGYSDMEHATDATSGVFYYEQGPDGTGFYVATGTHAKSMVRRRASSDGAAIEAYIKPEARIVNIENLKSDMEAERKKLGDLPSKVGDLNAIREHQVLELILADPGRYALLKGYDAIKLKTDGYLITNPGCLVVNPSLIPISDL
ncbi:hypothetical protein SP15_271 [Bacillus phage SP-15]|uniref:Uncharacterized protein n=1 Tax=Bacillus phage SP-15 TaxID=1792032 RepID=A0A127AWP1_9CAUD|nr:hypothetical protein SP15_271 [Bacillus phage SP-15]AMM45078.1 hypothetical protein SP15_271 [Bacillus phage SP-15]